MLLSETPAQGCLPNPPPTREGAEDLLVASAVAAVEIPVPVLERTECSGWCEFDTTDKDPNPR